MKLLHWLTFLLLIGSFALGFSMVDLPISPQRLKWYSYHKWIGVTIFVLVIVRLAWRLLSSHPSPVAMPKWQKYLMRSVHLGMYVLLFAIPVTGWLTSSAFGFQTVYLGVLPLPDLLEKDKMLAENLADLHAVLGFALLSLFVLHVAGALKHHFVDRDATLMRMLPFMKVR